MMRVRDVMTAPAITVNPDASYHAVVECLLANDISGAPVVDTDGRLLGIVTEADLMLKEAYGGPCGSQALALVGEIIDGYPASWTTKITAATAADLMTKETIVASPDDDLAEATRRMLRGACNQLPVVRDGHVIGIVSRHDVLRRFSRSDRDITLDVNSSIARRGADAAYVEVAVDDGIVSLRGRVPSTDLARSLRDEIAAIDGVVTVDANVDVRAEG